MKSLAVITLSAVLLGGAGRVEAQTNAAASPSSGIPIAPPHFAGTNHAEEPKSPPGGTKPLNNPGNSHGWGTNHWWTNAAGTNSPRRAEPGPTGAPPRGLPTDVQVVVRQFQRQSALLANQLNNASDAQRKQILQQLEALREQLQSEVEAWRETAKDQAKQMQRPFANPYAPGSVGSGAKGNPRHSLDY